MKCCEMDAGKLRNKIKVEREVRTPDGGGGVLKTWATVSEMWAWVNPVSSLERLETMKTTHIISHDIVIRYTDDINPRDRIIFKGRAFQIVSLINLEERNIWINIKGLEGVAT